jgi:hypothetical protein
MRLACSFCNELPGELPVASLPAFWLLGNDGRLAVRRCTWPWQFFRFSRLIDTSGLQMDHGVVARESL